MNDSDPKPDTDVDLLLRALHRADQDWPNRKDLERYWQDSKYFRPFESIELAEMAIQKFHERESVESGIREIGWNIRETSIQAFLDAYADTANGNLRSSVQHIITRLLSTSSFNRLEGFLRDVADKGAEKAIRAHRQVDRGSKYGHIFAGALASIEIAVLVLVLDASQSGFQTVVTCGLGLIYSATVFQGLASNDFNVRRFAAVVGETSRIRYLLRDRSLKRDEVEEEFLELDTTLAKSQVRYWIGAAKLCIIDLICIVVLVKNVL